MTPAFRVTYDIVTPESAAHGDIESAGFLDANGDPAAMLNTSRPPAMRLRQAVALMGGAIEDSGHWFSEADGRPDYYSGAEERRALHPPRNITAASYGRLARLLGVL
jgi:hypothetical protein